jgi:putative spermidine/putrescine transport system substrate-binding protein
MSKEMRRPILIAVVIFFALSLSGVAVAGGLQKIGKLEGYVDIVAWPGYIERGDTDPSYDWVTEFEKQCDCKWWP